VSEPGQNYFYSNGYDLLNEMLANGSILSEIIFFFAQEPYLLSIIKQPCGSCTSLHFSPLTLMMMQKIRLILVKSETDCYDFVCQLPLFTHYVQVCQEDPFGNQENLLNVFPAALARTVSCGEEDPVALL